MAFSVSATTRRRRPGEVDGVDYYFTNEADFKDRVAKHEFIEWEEVYHDTFYGTLKLEVERLWQLGKAVIFDVDVKGAVNLKKKFGDQALSLFIKPPSEQALEERLLNRNTEDWDKIEERINKAKTELQYESYFDKTVINDQLPEAIESATKQVFTFLNE